MEALKQIIESAWEDRSLLKDKGVIDAIEDIVDKWLRTKEHISKILWQLDKEDEEEEEDKESKSRDEKKEETLEN